MNAVETTEGDLTVLTAPDLTVPGATVRIEIEPPDHKGIRLVTMVTVEGRGEPCPAPAASAFVIAARMIRLVS